MPMWRCPHCETPQTETARCWVCRRSSTACGTCRNFRRSVAGQLGYCGLDRQRRPLIGDEIRACWQSRPAPAEEPETGSRSWIGLSPALDAGRTPVRRLEFVEVAATRVAHPGPTGASDRHGSPHGEESPERTGEPVLTPADPGWSLWGDAEF